MQRLDGSLLKVKRAISEIQRLSIAEEAFRRDARYKIVRAELNSKTGEYAYRLRIERAPNLEDWGVYVGEIAHNLRSALDGLVYQLVRLNNKTPTTRIQFPVFRVGRTVRKPRGELIPHFENTRNPKRGIKTGDGRRMIRDLKPKHQAIIEGFQPYKRRNKHAIAGFGRNNVLYLLSELNNADKHRLLQVLGVKPIAVSWGHWESETVPTAGTFDVTGPRLKVLKDGVKILEAPADVRVIPDVIPLIAFSKGCDAVQNKAVLFTLLAITKQVRIILKRFEPEFPSNWEP